MTDIPKMPDDFWPEITVVGKRGNVELAFALTSKERAENTFMPAIKSLVQAIWQAMHDERYRAKFGIQEDGQSFREIKQGIKDGASV
jgi:hypothetical protein